MPHVGTVVVINPNVKGNTMPINPVDLDKVVRTVQQLRMINKVVARPVAIAERAVCLAAADLLEELVPAAKASPVEEAVAEGSKELGEGDSEKQDLAAEAEQDEEALAGDDTLTPAEQSEEDDQNELKDGKD